MGSINFSLREFYDGATEIVGIKSGILLNRFQVAKILNENNEEEYLKSDDLDLWIRVESTEYEGFLLAIRQRIGNLPEHLPSEKAFAYLREYIGKTKELNIIGKGQAIAFNYIMQNKEIGLKELTDLLSNKEVFSKDLSYAIAIIALEQEDLSCIITSPTNWDGKTELSDLYNCEILSENNFLDQKFIDYLAVNGNEIELIHWRNFERFCAEYFKKQGYIVILGPGTNDGGIDIRAYKEHGGAPDFVIQCKRYSKGKKVTIETVKSFYTDVVFENAKNGLIATTGYIAKGGKKVCETRGYNIKFAEKRYIKNWAKEMWKFK